VFTVPQVLAHVYELEFVAVLHIDLYEGVAVAKSLGPDGFVYDHLLAHHFVRGVLYHHCVLTRLVTHQEAFHHRALLEFEVDVGSLKLLEVQVENNEVLAIHHHDAVAVQHLYRPQVCHRVEFVNAGELGHCAHLFQ